MLLQRSWTYTYWCLLGGGLRPTLTVLFTHGHMVFQTSSVFLVIVPAILNCGQTLSTGDMYIWSNGRQPETETSYMDPWSS